MVCFEDDAHNATITDLVNVVCLSISNAAHDSVLVCAPYMCVVMWGGRSFGLHTSKVRAKDRGHTYSLHRTHMGCLTWTVRAHVL
jgi:hypothetical protein